MQQEKPEDGIVIPRTSFNRVTLGSIAATTTALVPVLVLSTSATTVVVVAFTPASASLSQVGMCPHRHEVTSKKRVSPQGYWWTSTGA